MKLLFPFFALLVTLNACTKPIVNDGDTVVPPVNPPDVCYARRSDPKPLPDINLSSYTTYYINNENGSDYNDGLSSKTPFQTLSKISDLPKKEGIRVLLKSGSQFTGCLNLDDVCASETQPFIVDIYGGTERAHIDGRGVYAAISIKVENVRVSNLDVTNKSGKLGCWIQTTKAGAMKNIQIENCRFYEINWKGNQDFIGKRPEDINVYQICPDETYAKYYGGITADALTTKEVGPSWFENLYLINNEFFQVCRTGILISTQWGQRVDDWGYNDFVSDEEGWYPNKNVVIQGNRFEYIGGDGLILGGCIDSFIDHNTCYYANFLGRTGNASAGLWPYMCVNTVMQYNEVAYTQWANGSADGEGLDIDGACKNTICQYNYIHHNVGGGLLMCNIKDQEHNGHVVRNNVFAFNGGKDKGCFMVISSGVGSTDVYNNLVVTSTPDTRIIYSDDYAHCGNNHDFTFRNNIFMSTNSCVGIFDHSYIDNAVFENNLFYNVGNFPKLDKYQKRYDPEIVIPTQFDGWDKVVQFKPGATNIYKDGMLFNGMAETDINQNPVVGIAYMGPFAK